MWTDTTYILLFIVGLFLILLLPVLLSMWLTKRKLSQETGPIHPDIIELLQGIEITNVSFIRNKIVIDVEDAYSFPAEHLKERGAKGITIVGNRVKFYVDGTAIDNENLYNEIMKKIKGE